MAEARRRRNAKPWWYRHPVLAEKLLLAFNTFWQAFTAQEIVFNNGWLRTALVSGGAALLSFVPKVVTEALEHLKVRIAEIRAQG